MELSGNKILITGATSGIGAALVHEFLALNNKVIALGRNLTSLNELAELSDQVTVYQCDLAEEKNLRKLVLFLESEHSDLNILINNAGIQYNYHFFEEKQAVQKIEHEITVNLIAPIKLISLLLPTLKSNHNAAIVNVSSGLGLVPKMAAPVYCATKAGVHIFSKALRHQLGEVKVFEIIPPLVDTPMTRGRGKDKISPQELAKEFIDRFKRNQLEISIGKVKLLKAVNRISPRLADKIMKGTM